MRSRRIVAALLCAFIVATAVLGAEPSRLPPERDTWQFGVSSHFVFYSNAGEARVQELARTLERLVDVLASRKGSKGSPVPTAIYVFRDDRSFAPYKRNPDGTVKNLSGFFVKDDLSNYVALDGSTPTPAVVLHEYLHQFSAYNFPPLPIWLNEGLAEFYSTFSATDRQAEVGRPVRDHVLGLRSAKLLPLPRLFAVTKDDPEYNEASKQGVFYAESWALVHLLLVGNKERHGQLTAFIDRLGAGQSPQQALAVLGDLGALQKELETYIKGSAFAFRKESFEERDLALGVVFEPMAREDVLFRLGDLLLHSSELRADAAAHFKAALALAPTHAKAMGGLALIDAAAGNWQQAAAGFGRAVAASPEDAELRLRLAQALYQAEFESGAEPTGKELPDRIRQAREHAAKAAALRPNEFDSQFLLGLTYTFQAEALDPGIAALERAHALAPGRSDVLLALGSLQMMDDRLDEARASLGEVVRGSSEPELVAQARENLAEVSIQQALGEGQRTRDTAKAAAAIRAAMPDLRPERRAEMEVLLAQLSGEPAPASPDADEKVEKPELTSTDPQAHLRYGTQQVVAAGKAEGKAGEGLAKEAIQHFRRATELDPASAEAWFGVALACVRASCPTEDGMAAAEKGRALKPEDVWGTYLLANYRIDARQPEQARELLRPLLELDHPMQGEIRLTDVRARVSQSQALVQAGKTEEALKVLQEGPLPEDERRGEAEAWLREARSGAELRYWSDRLVQGSEARQRGQAAQARKILEDIVARCPEKELVKMAGQELALMRK